MSECSPLLHPTIAIAKKAAEAILTVYRAQEMSVQLKPDHSPLTEADLLANTIIVNSLRDLTPQFPILSEEGQQADWQQRRQWSSYWLIDPLDGTRQFISHSDEFTVNIALIENHQPVLGIIYVPITGECYYAQKGGLAQKSTADGKISHLHVRTWRPDQTVILASRGVHEDRLKQRFNGIGPYTLIKMSSSWKFCLLAEGKADICPRFGDTYEWDTAAGHCILEQAGGALLNSDGEPMRYNRGNSLLNPHFIGLGDAQALKEKLPWGHWPS